MFSKDETHELPIDVHTQYFMKDEANARISVLTHIDTRELHFRKQDDRNLDNLTFVTVVFDQDGHEVIGQQKLLELRLRDLSVQKYAQSGINDPDLHLTSSPARTWCGRWCAMQKLAKFPPSFAPWKFPIRRSNYAATSMAVDDGPAGGSGRDGLAIGHGPCRRGWRAKSFCASGNFTNDHQNGE